MHFYDSVIVFRGDLKLSSLFTAEILKGVSAEFLSEKNVCTDELKLRRIAEREGRRYGVFSFSFYYFIYFNQCINYL